MMNKNILPRDEFIAKFNLQDGSLQEWEKAKLVKPAGFTNHNVALYSDEVIEHIADGRPLDLSQFIGPEDSERPEPASTQSRP